MVGMKHTGDEKREKARKARIRARKVQGETCDFCGGKCDPHARVSINYGDTRTETLEVAGFNLCRGCADLWLGQVNPTDAAASRNVAQTIRDILGDTISDGMMEATGR